MHSGTVFWGTKEELRRIMIVVEQTDAQVQMFEREQGDWALHVNFAGAEVSRLALENIRLSAMCSELNEVVTELTSALKSQTRVTLALNSLVRLKDGPADDLDRPDEPAAWAEARVALATVTEVSD